MIKSITTIILLIMIFITASGIPLYADTMNFNGLISFSPPAEDITILDHQINTTGLQPQLQLILAPNNRLTSDEFMETYALELLLYHNDNIVKTFDLSTLNPSILKIEFTDDSKTSMVLSLNLSQELLDLPNGNYLVEVHLLNESTASSVVSDKLALTYNASFNYVPSLNTINRNQTALKLYFPDNNSNYLIPITRIVPYTNTPLRSTLDNLQAGPHTDLGLPKDSPIPSIQRLGLSRGIAQVYLPNDLGIYNQYASSARLAVDSIVKSLTSIDEVSSVQFYFNNQIRSEGFHGMIMDQPIYPDENPEFFIGYITEKDRMLLLPIPMDIQSLSISQIFEVLKYGSESIGYSYTLQPPIPNDVELLNYTMEEGLLQLTFNDKFLEVYRNDPTKGALMVDALLFTFASLDYVDLLTFHVESPPSSIPKGLSINDALLAPQYINPE